MRRSIITVDSFFGSAGELRDHFDSRFADPHSSDSGRFVWDFWHVPGQYTTLRTPAYHFFPASLYRSLHEKLVLWGRTQLGCHDISPPWLSCYVDGCRQEFHADLPHGPWAFVFSLTPWNRRKFTGGETFLLDDGILSYWRNIDSYTRQGLEESRILRTVEPRFNRLTVFDPRIPHGVRRVEGVSDPREGRLVVHGWFVQPRPFISGPLPAKAAQAAIDRVVGKLDSELREEVPLRGILSLRLTIAGRGECEKVQVLSNTLVPLDPSPGLVERLLRLIGRELRRHRFPKAPRGSAMTIPIIFG